MKPLNTVYHILAFSWYAFLLMSMAAKAGENMPPVLLEHGGPWKFLTFWNLILQIVFFGLAVVDDLQTGRKSSKLLNRCKDLLFSVVVFPVGMFVVLLFWMIFAYDRELVYPNNMDTFIPPWMNHGMHTFVFPFLLGELLVQPHAYPQARHGIAGLAAVGFCYLSWVIWLYLSAGVWVYPLLGLFSTGSLVGLILVCMSFAISLYLLGEKINCCVWGKQKESSMAKRK